jgi:hypothetical protein
MIEFFTAAVKLVDTDEPPEARKVFEKPATLWRCRRRGAQQTPFSDPPTYDPGPWLFSKTT